MGFNGALAICLQLKGVQTLVHPWVALGGFFSSGSGSNAAINYKKSLTLTAVYNAVEQISNDIAKYRFPLTKKSNNRESKPNHPAHKLVSFLLTA
jgi:phage portal protein BeeE